LTKPFDRGELLARLRAISRRPWDNQYPVTTFDDPPLRVDYAQRQARIDGVPVSLTPLEFSLLATLTRHQGQVLSADQLIELAWKDPTGLAPGRVKFGMKRLREKMGWDLSEGSPIETVRGFGYRYRSRTQ
jgi:DNA-binding response OmpR family regulator